MWIAFTRASCALALAALLVILGTLVAGALTDWPVEGVRRIASAVLLLALCVVVTSLFLDPTSDPATEARQHARAPCAEDLERLEQTLDVSLPDAYRAVMLDFPVRFERGNALLAIWNDVDALVERSQRLRAGPHPWPTRYLFIGCDGAAEEYYALDFDRQGAGVAVFEEPSDPGRGARPTEFTTLDRLCHDLREQVAGDGLDPDAERRPPPEALASRMRGCMIAWAVILALGVGIGSCMAWLSSP